MTARTGALGSLRTPEVRQAAAALPPRPSPRTPETPNDAGRCPTAPPRAPARTLLRTPLTSGSGPTAASPSRADAAPSLTASSHKPPARPASGPQDGGRGYGGADEAPSCHGDARQAGEVRLDDNGRIEAELGLAPLPEWALLCVPLDEKERGARGRWVAVSRVSHTPRRSPLK